MTRWATKPPNCAAMKSADDAVAQEMVKQGKLQPGQPAPKLTMGPKDAASRKVWMDAYEKACGKNAAKHISRTDPHLKPGELTNWCRGGTGSIAVTVVDMLNRKPIAGAQVHVEGRGPVTTDASGRAVISGLKPGVHQVIVTGKGMRQASTTAPVADGQTTPVTVEVLNEDRCQKERHEAARRARELAEAKQEVTKWETEVRQEQQNWEFNCTGTDAAPGDDDARDKGGKFLCAAIVIRLESAKYKLNKAQDRVKQAQKALDDANKAYSACAAGGK